MTSKPDIRFRPLTNEKDLYLLRVGAPVQHRTRPDAVGVIERAFYDGSALYYVVEWLVEGFAPQIPAGWVRELPSEMHLLASL